MRVLNFCRHAAALAAAVVSLSSAASAETYKTFDVEPQTVYRLRLKTDAVKEGASAKIVFLDERGEDVSRTEEELGFALSGASASLPKEGGETLLVSAAGNGIVKAVRARLDIEGADASVVRECSFEPHDAGEDPKHTSGVVSSTTGEGTFSRNLVNNPSFEEDGGWRWLGSEKGASAFRFSGDSYTGARSAALDPATDGEGALTSDAFPIDPSASLHYSYAVRYSRFAKPHGHVNPVRLEFLSKGSSGALRVISRFDQEFAFMKYNKFAGEWMIVNVRNIRVPANATHARVIVEHRDVANIWSGSRAASWGTVLADDVSVWQGDGLPPRLPAGRMRDNSVFAVQDAWRDGALFFDSDGVAKLTFRMENLLAWDRKLELHGTVSDSRLKTVGKPFERSFSLAPFASGPQEFELPEVPRYGAYQIDCEIVEPGVGTVCRTRGLFARIAHPSRATAADKASGFYPFDMHPGSLSFTADSKSRLEECEYEARMMSVLGVRGTRLAAGYSQMGFDSKALDSATGERIDELAEAAVAKFRKNVKPIMDRYGVRGWITLGLQGRKNTAGAVKTPEQLEKWERFHRSFARALDGDVDFILMDSEGQGAYTAHLGDDDDLFPVSAFNGTPREWMNAVCHALKGLKDGNPSLPAGVAHANDREATVAKRFLRMTGGAVAVDCWGCNSYTGPQIIAPAIYNAFGKERASKIFFVIPELGETSNTPEKADAAAHAMLRYYVQTLARAPWTRHIDWFRFAPSVFENSAGGGARATAAAFAVMTDTLRAGSAGKEVPLTGGAFIPWRRLDGSSVAVAWSSAGQKVVFAVPDGRRLVESDVYGNRREHVPAGGRVEVAVGSVAYYWIEGKVISAPGFAPGCMPVDEESVMRERVRVELAAARSSGSANLVRNAAFVGEGTNLPPEWKGETPPGANGTKLEDCRFTREVGAGPGGEAALFIDNRVKDKLKGGSYPVISQEVPVEEGETYVFRVLFKSVRSGQWIQGQIDTLDARGKVKRRIPAPESQEMEGEWAMRELEFTVQQDETAVRILLKGNGGGTGAFYFARPELRRVERRMSE